MLYPEEQGLYTIIVAHQRIRHAVSRSTNTQPCQGDTFTPIITCAIGQRIL